MLLFWFGGAGGDCILFGSFRGGLPGGVCYYGIDPFAHLKALLFDCE